MSAIPPRPDGIHGGAIAPASTGPEPSQRPTWGIGEALAAYVLAFALAAIASVPLFAVIGTSDTAAVGANVAVAGVVAGALVLWLRLRHPGWVAAVGLRAPRALRDLAVGFGFGLVVYPAVAFVVASSFGFLLQRVTGAPVQTPEQVPTDLPVLGTVFVAVYALLIAPVAEEFFFRGILFSAARARLGLWAGALVSGVAFGLIHYVPAAWPSAVLLMAVMVPTGMAFAWIRARRGSLYASIGAHVAFNVIGLILIYASR